MAIFGKKTQNTVKKETAKKTGKEVKIVVPKNQKDRDVTLAWNILKVAHITEKATDLLANNKYVFNVFKGANKEQVKKSVEGIYGVNVVSVNMINIPAKKRRMGRSEGWRQGYKKAIVQLKEGQEIELMPR